jgi:Phage tail repeat like
VILHGHADATTGLSGFMSGADKTKLNGIATAATANATDAQLRDRTTHTGAQAIATVTGLQAALDAKAAAVHTHVLADLTNVTITAANLNALDDGVDTTLHFHASDRDRANHTGTQLSGTISDFSEAVDDRVAALLVPGSNITLTYNDAANTFTIAATLSGGSGLTHKQTMRRTRAYS